MLGLAAVPSTLQFIGMIYLPESPRWLGKMDWPAASKQVMKRIYKPEYLEEANMELMLEIENLKIETKMTERERLRSLFKTYGRCLVIGCTLQAIQQLVGINTAMYYGPDIIKKSGIRIEGLEAD